MIDSTVACAVIALDRRANEMTCYSHGVKLLCEKVAVTGLKRHFETNFLHIKQSLKLLRHSIREVQFLLSFSSFCPENNPDN